MVDVRQGNGTGAVGGALWGMLFGLMFLMPVAGTLVGATGALMKLLHTSLSQEAVDKLQAARANQRARVSA
jgi:uncharacterized membrane protein